MSQHYIERVPLNVLAAVPKKPVERARKRSMDAVKLTFENLKGLMRDKIHCAKGLSPSSLPNLHSALDAFIRERQLSIEHPIGSTLRASYYNHIRSHVESLKLEGRTKEYISNRKAILKQWRKCVLDYDRYCSAQLQGPHPFQQAIDDILANGMTRKGLARESGISLATLKRWQRGSMPSARSMGHVSRLERLLGLEVGALCDLLPSRKLQAAQDASLGGPTIAYRV